LPRVKSDTWQGIATCQIWHVARYRHVSSYL